MEAVVARGRNGNMRCQRCRSPLKLYLYMLLPVLILLLPALTQATGEMINNSRLGPVKSFRETLGKICLRPLGDQSTEAAIRLEIKSTFKNIITTAGNSTIPPDQLAPDTWHTLRFQHSIVNYRHSLDVEVDNRSIIFKKTNNKMFTSSYNFDQVRLFLKGRVEVSDCSPTEDPTVTTITTTTTTTTSTTTTMMTTSTSATTTEQQPTSDTVIVGGNPWLQSLGDIGGMPIVLIILVIVIIVVIIIVVVLCYRCKQKQKQETNGKDQRTAVEFQPSLDSETPKATYSKLHPAQKDMLTTMTSPSSPNSYQGPPAYTNHTTTFKPRNQVSTPNSPNTTNGNTAENINTPVNSVSPSTSPNTPTYSFPNDTVYPTMSEYQTRLQN
ncbi:transcription initiation factor TFIID subunit 1-like isoform X3 [Homarus americanus]|uniref:transcription initiation factor TFIID subunit 1-like isoform X3 n=1 Tax=Homarus americanus TaxID=6706 RepID=UPI001C458A22|nr:transcription initiation factor TFIID subunit 1-like isoform X3 [Homarus americanus]